MVNTVVLDIEKHVDLLVDPARGAQYGDHVNQALVFPNEFTALQREYPILFRKDTHGVMQAVVLLGLDADENLFLNGNSWDAEYMPAIQARGPFSIGLPSTAQPAHADSNMLIHIDLDNPAVGTQTGQALFLRHGGHSPYLSYIIKVLETLHDGLAISRDFFDLLAELDLLEGLTLEIQIDESRQYSVPNVYSINEQKFRNLPAHELDRLHRSGALLYCHCALMSLDNIRRLVDRKNRAERA
jgi:hypothetical protein